MPKTSLLPLAALGLWFIAAPASSADNVEKADPVRIAKLVEQLGSDDFDEREKASAALDALGEPALNSLRQAVNSTDEEVHKRAETLVAHIEKRLETAAVLKAKRLHLVYKDEPLKDALDDFERKSGYHFALYHMENKLKDRTITLDTGDAPFWQACDQFCDKAGLKDIEVRDQKPLWPGVTTEPITLTDGQAAGRPADAATAVRVRLQTKADRPDSPQKEEIPLALQLSLEPRLQWRTAETVTITKAVDDQGQELMQSADPPSAVPPPALGAGVIVRGGIATAVGNPEGVSIHQDLPFRLKKSDKASKSLTELSGTISASIFTETKPIITAPDILKAAGKTFKGGDDGQLKVIAVSMDDNGRVTLRLELQAPADVVADGAPIGRGVIRRLGRGAPIAVAPPGGIVAVRGAVFVGGAGSSAGGISLLDDKGEVVKLTGMQMQFTAVAAPGAGIANVLQHVLTFQTEKGQEPAKLVYSGRKILSMEIPFTIKEVPLP